MVTQKKLTLKQHDDRVVYRSVMRSVGRYVDVRRLINWYIDR